MTQPASIEDARELAHDLNNLLTAIIGTADAALERSAIDPETRADVAHIREGAVRGAAMELRFGGDRRRPPGVPRLISINDTIRGTWRLLDHRLGQHITLALELAEPDARVIADPSELDRALFNLVVNARHAIAHEGSVTLTTSRQSVSVTECRVPDTIPPGDYVAIAVVDTGAGIAVEQLPRIFDAGFSSREGSGGSGLGLASTHEIVRRLNGFLSVKSVEGQGARFEIWLPLIEDAPVPDAAPITAARIVLLVEDDPFVRQVTQRAMHRAGWIVRCADSAEEALAVSREMSFDLMISDIAMPGMDGTELARLMLAREPGLPIILTSGYERSADDLQMRVANIAFLAKPYDQAELLALVARIAGERRIGI